VALAIELATDALLVIVIDKNTPSEMMPWRVHRSI